MKIFTKTILIIIAFAMLAQQINAFDMQKAKDFLGFSTTKITQSICNNKQAYTFGAVAIGAIALGLGWYYYATKNAPKANPTDTKPIELKVEPTKPTITQPIARIEPIISKAPSQSNTAIIPIEYDLINEFNTILKNLTEIKVDTSLLKELEHIKTFLSEKPANLECALQMLKSLQQNKQIFSSDYGDLSGEQLFSMYFEEFIKKLQLQIQASQLHIVGRPYGLVNNNNSCLMNAAIQCLFSLEKINEVLLKNAQCYKQSSLTENYVQLLNTMQTEKKSIINPSSFCQNGWKLFGEGLLTQQDSSEFVQRVLQALIEEDINREVVPQGKNNDLLNLLNVTVSENLCDSMGALIFQESVNTWPILPPLIISDNHKTLNDCLQNSFIQEQSKTKILENVSHYFLIRLSRDGFNKATKQQFKIEQPISFELENLCIDKLSRNSKKFPLYQCKAFILHNGNHHSGHYIAFVKKNNTWFLCDDATIVPVSYAIINDIAKQGIFAQEGKENKKIFTPMMFFYEKQSQ